LGAEEIDIIIKKNSETAEEISPFFLCEIERSTLRIYQFPKILREKAPIKFDGIMSLWLA
jgi:hypothetical protein